MKFFKRKNKSDEYTTSRNNPITDNYMERLISIVKVVNIYKSIIFILFVIVVSLTGSLIYFANQQKIVPYIVKVENDTGKVISSEILKNNSNTVTEKEIKYFLSQFVINTNTITLDKNYYLKTLKQEQYFLTTLTQSKLQDYLKKEELLSNFDSKNTVTIEIISYIAIPNLKNNYQIRWIEKTYNSKGQKLFEKVKAGVFKLNYYTPNEKQVEINPFGIVIEDFNITLEK